MLYIGGLDMTSSKHDHANYDQFAQNFGMACNTIQGVPVPNFMLFGENKYRIMGHNKLENFLKCYMGK